MNSAPTFVNVDLNGKAELRAEKTDRPNAFSIVDEKYRVKNEKGDSERRRALFISFAREDIPAFDFPKIISEIDVPLVLGKGDGVDRSHAWIDFFEFAQFLSAPHFPKNKLRVFAPDCNR